MQLIDEIEAASLVWEKDSASAAEVVESPWWPRIRAALLAGEEMAQHLDGASPPPDCGYTVYWYIDSKAALRRFRAATEGTGKDGLQVGGDATEGTK